ncbi:MAG: LysR family transcriptional regulator [Desulfobacteraceae bacterium]|jgi:DNA-binding transcriptional LysR family regulator
MLPDFNRLKVFYHVYCLKSMTAAAEPLHLSPSAVSQHIQKLEDELRTPLFTRLPRKLVSTPSGDRLFAVLKPFVVGLEQSLQDIQAARSVPRGLLRLGAPTAFGENILPRYMAAYRKNYPEVRFHLQLGHPSILLPAVRKGKLDFAFADIFSSQNPDTVGKDSLVSRPVIEEPLILVCSTSYFQDQIKDKNKPQVFQTATFITYEPFAPALRSWMKHHFENFQIKPDIVLSVESVRAVITAIENHMGLGVVPAYLVETAISKGDLTCIRSNRNPMINHIAVVQLANKIPTITEKSFIGHVEKQWQMESRQRY